MRLYTPVNTTSGFITHWRPKPALLFLVQQLRASPCLTTKHQGKDVKKLHTKPARMSKWYNTNKEDCPQGIKLKVRKQLRKSYQPWKVGEGIEWRKGEAEVGDITERAEERQEGGLIKTVWFQDMPWELKLPFVSILMLLCHVFQPTI